ncbi:MAG: signal recognition particle-docking protein FtsY [Candidatus Thermoplasmatota archaeon]|nr:signal recognition particle-docking protein FtsY [Candidatus Thermoplasmatota archaeon]
MFKALKEKLKILHKKGEEELKAEPLPKETKIDKILWALELIMLEADVALPVIDKIKEDVKKELATKKLGRDVKSVIEETLKSAISNILHSAVSDFDKLVSERQKPIKLLFVGINGSGKTSAIAKLAWRLKKSNYRCVLAASDTFRAGAIEQLEKHASALGAKLIKHLPGSDPAAVAYDAVEHAKARNIDFVLIDTAGRMQTNVNLMDEMKKLNRVIAPDFIIFVGDALTGNDAVEQAKTFNDELGIDAVILTKIDADAKGGAALSVAYTIGKPILFLSTGQGYEDFIEFDPKWMVDRLFG